MTYRQETTLRKDSTIEKRTHLASLAFVGKQNKQSIYWWTIWEEKKNSKNRQTSQLAQQIHRKTVSEKVIVLSFGKLH